jgi:hypothetical protein
MPTTPKTAVKLNLGDNRKFALWYLRSSRGNINFIRLPKIKNTFFPLRGNYVDNVTRNLTNWLFLIQINLVTSEKWENRIRRSLAKINDY